MTRHRGNLRRPALAVGLLALLAACSQEDAPQTVLDPQGPVARQIDRLSDPVFWVAGFVFVLVQGLVLGACLKFRDRGQPEPEQIHGNTRLEVAWTLAPALILLLIAVPTIATIFSLARPVASSENPVNVTVIGHQFWWEYRYDDEDIITANELVIPVDRPVELTLESVDVIHSYWVPALGGKTDVIPGRTNRMRFTAETPGYYPGQCTEFCGLSHANMRNVARVLSTGDFDAWITRQKQVPAPPPEGSPAAEGLSLFTGRGCGGCHTVATVSEGKIGPELTHFGDRSIVANIFPNDEQGLRRWLSDPLGEKPGNDMKIPGLPLKPDEIEKLIAYLETLK